MCEIYSRWSGGRRFGHFIIFCHPCPDWQQAAVRVGNLTLNIVCLTRGIGFRNLIQNRLNKLGKYWLLEISQNKKSCVDTTNYIRLEGWFVVDVGAGDGPLSRRGWGWVFSLIGDQSAVFCKPFTDLSTVSTRTGDSAPLLLWGIKNGHSRIWDMPTFAPPSSFFSHLSHICWEFRLVFYKC